LCGLAQRDKENTHVEIVFDMRSVDYLSSAGIRVILKAKKALEKMLKNQINRSIKSCERLQLGNEGLV
jgi:anti-anti-sigma regulatory factor